MRSTKNIINLFVGLLLVSRATYGSHISSYVNGDVLHVTTPEIISEKTPLLNPPPLPNKNKKAKPPLYTKFVQKIVDLNQFNCKFPNSTITCPTSFEEANDLLINYFGNNIEEWSKFIAHCYAEYSRYYDSREKKIVEVGGDLKLNDIKEFRAFFHDMLANYITMLINQGSLDFLSVPTERSERIILKNILWQHCGNLFTLWDKAHQKTTDTSEVAGIINNHEIATIEERIFKIMQYLGYYDFLNYILSDDFTNTHPVDAALFEKIILFTQENLTKITNKKEAATDLVSLFRNKIREYAPADVKRKTMENFIAKYNDQANIQIHELEQQTQAYQKKIETTETELAKTRVQLQQKTESLETQIKKNNADAILAKDVKKTLIAEQTELQRTIDTLTRQKQACENDKKQLIATNTLLEKKLTTAMKTEETLKEDNQNKESSIKKCAEISKILEQQLEQKIKDHDALMKQTGTLKQQHEITKKERAELEQQIEILKQKSEENINELTKVNKQLKQQFEQATKQLQLIKAPENPEITSFFGKEIAKEQIISNLKSIQSELQAANIQPNRDAKGQWGQFAFFINTLLDQDVLKK